MLYVQRSPEKLVQFGSIHLFDPATAKEPAVPIQLTGDFPAVRPHYVKVGGKIEKATISPTAACRVCLRCGE